MTMNRRQLALGGAAMLVTAPSLLRAQSDPINPQLLAAAMAALQSHSTRIRHRDYVGVVDFAQHSRHPRFYIVDSSGAVRHRMHVAHGRGSDPARTGMVQSFSNQSGSNASSRGAYLTGDEYQGKHGRSRRLAGLDSSNDNASARYIVIHSADYLDASFIRQNGLAGRSQGCPAVSAADLPTVMTLLGPGRLLYIDKL
jgi:L,D-transpeptidase catalytic domain